MSNSYEIALMWMAQDEFEIIGSGNGLGNGLVLSGNKPLPKPVLTKISGDTWRYDASVSWLDVIVFSWEYNAWILHWPQPA